MRNGVLYCSNRSPAPQQCQIIQANLRQIGLEMEIRLFPRATQFELTGRRGEPFDMTLEGWHMDYFDPFDFLFLLDGTRLGLPGSTGNVNFAYFDDPGYNGRIQAASQLQGDARANAFGELDVDIAQNAAPWAPYGVPNDRHFFSERVGCQTYVPAFGISLGALCLRPASTRSLRDRLREPRISRSAHRWGRILPEHEPHDWAWLDRRLDYQPTSDLRVRPADDHRAISTALVRTAHESNETTSCRHRQVRRRKRATRTIGARALANGRWWFHLRTRDNAGNWTSTRHLGPFVIVPRPRCVVPNVRGKRCPGAPDAYQQALRAWQGDQGVLREGQARTDHPPEP